MTKAALEVAQKVVAQEARRLRRFNVSSDTSSELEAEGLLRAVEAWATFRPERGEWAAHCRMYVRTYATRASNRAKSVVDTNYATRKVERDEGMVVMGEGGEWTERDFESEGSGADERVAARQSLSAVYAECQWALRALPETQAAIARDWLESGGEMKAGELAKLHNVTPTTVHKALRAMKDAAAAAAV